MHATLKRPITVTLRDDQGQPTGTAQTTDAVMHMSIAGATDDPAGWTISCSVMPMHAGQMYPADGVHRSYRSATAPAQIRAGVDQVVDKIVRQMIKDVDL